MHIIRFTLFFQLTKNSKNLASFLFLPNANLNPDFHKCMPFGKVTTPLPCVLARSMHTRHTSVFVLQIHHTLPLDTDYIT